MSIKTQKIRLETLNSEILKSEKSVDNLANQRQQANI